MVTINLKGRAYLGHTDTGLHLIGDQASGQVTIFSECKLIVGELIFFLTSEGYIQPAYSTVRKAQSKPHLLTEMRTFEQENGCRKVSDINMCVEDFCTKQNSVIAV